MPWMPQTNASEVSSRPPLTSQQSNSLPSTPYQHARKLSLNSRSPSPVRGSTSPRSTYSESTHIPPSARKPLGGCKYETAMAYFRRRIPYSLGADLLPEEKEGLKEHLEPDEERRLTADIMDLYDELLPSAESDDRRRQLVAKVEKLFNEQWPGHEIKANVFGSSGNKLCSSDSDVDICITTDYKDLEHVCLLAEVLAKHGMERVVCVSHAKVPIVKIWDPELKLACDMNVNNTLALENTRMIRTYVDVDERVRPLAMSVKHWTKRRILNDAALGGTLSSYTWICLIINFLQTRNPPVLPSLQARPHEKRATPDGLVYSFDDDLDTLRQFGQKNKETVGELFFGFFRYYGHEINYEENVISVREGKLVSKEAKGWHLSVNNRLCVEEPFNTSRNLGNTADDTSFRGLHMELRRAFKFASDADLAGCCAQFEFPPEEERTWERPPPQPRPVITAAYAPKGGRGTGGRGGRYGNNQYSRTAFSNGGRRTSNTGNKNAFRQPNPVGTSDLSFQAQQQAQFLLHDQLYQQIQLLQAQEQELRMQLHNQALITGRPPPVFLRQPFIQFPMPQQQEYLGGDETARSRSGTVSQPPLGSSPSHQQTHYPSPTYASISAAATQGTTTNPSSPCASNDHPDLRRDPRRPSLVNESPKANLRTQSQPARPQISPTLPAVPSLYSHPQALDTQFLSRQPPISEPSEIDEVGGDENVMPSGSLPSNASHQSEAVDDSRASEMIGYYYTPQQLQLYQQNALLSPLATTPMGFALPNGYASYMPVQPEYRSGSFSSEGVNPRSEQMSPPSQTFTVPGQRRSPSRPAPAMDRGPLIVDGSVPPSESRQRYEMDYVDPYATATHYTSTSDEHNMNTPASASDSLSQDFHDAISYDAEQQQVYSQAPLQPLKTFCVNGVADAPSNNPAEQPELLASRLQNLHLSNSEKLAQSPATPKTTSDRQKNGSMHTGLGKDTAATKSSANEKPSSSGTPSNNEARPQTSNTKRGRLNGVDANDKSNGVSHGNGHGHGNGHANGHSSAQGTKSKAKGRQDTANPLPNNAGDGKDRHADHGPRKTGNHANATNEANHSGWQTTSKKKHRKSGKSTAADSRSSAHGGREPLPDDVSLRKGG
ncbi:Uncharacterized protein PECH_003822 [Penicillium ucsense]|uniref:polynucleotide adenylyltransferase n=1 Tax=Penicillium ucsense TaxID=2839758 RepID=A0A8J8WHI7_9EURO|nr:Uncharacterized protein PECM_001721 [Penicillium ucsense]KAF7737372.1 Uncharacterized protein PECH_003822 [Penicillium ucsense]